MTMLWIRRRAIAWICIVLSCAAFAEGVKEEVVPLPEPSPEALQQQRCGWFDNPSAQNASLLDREGEWVISQSGGRSATGQWPARFRSSRWVRTGSGNYGYGCVCMTVLVNTKPRQIAHIVSSQSRPLAVCRNNRHLKGKEPFNPLNKL